MLLLETAPRDSPIEAVLAAAESDYLSADHTIDDRLRAVFKNEPVCELSMTEHGFALGGLCYLLGQNYIERSKDRTFLLDGLERDNPTEDDIEEYAYTLRENGRHFTKTANQIWQLLPKS